MERQPVPIGSAEVGPDDIEPYWVRAYFIHIHHNQKRVFFVGEDGFSVFEDGVSRVGDTFGSYGRKRIWIGQYIEMSERGLVLFENPE